MHRISFMRNKLGFVPFTILLVLLGITAFGIGGYVLVRHSLSGNPAPSPSLAVSVPRGSDWKIYVNAKYGYSIKYPADWTFREFPDTQTGAGFRLASAPDDLGHEDIVVDAYDRAASLQNVSFEEYARQAAGQEIQNYQSIASFQRIVTDSGLVGYVATWNVMPLGVASGTTNISGPIAYFHRDGNQVAVVSVRASKTVSSAVYDAMLATFSFANRATPSPVVAGGDRDSHGCIGSAGYTWCQAKDQCIRPWEQYCTAAQAKTVTFLCDAGKTIRATFYPTDDKFVDLALSDGRDMSVPHAISASGARYVKPDESFVFWNKGDTAFVMEGASSTETYGNCLLRGN